MRSKGMGPLCGVAALSLLLGHAEAQQTAPPPDSGLQVGPATIPKHWSRYRYPETIPDGVTYYIIVRGDTLWDLAGKYLGNPYLWPQIWDQNRYITDAHWIYPGDPLIMPKVALVSERAGEAGAGVAGAEEAGAGVAGQVIARPGEGEQLVPAIEEMALQCAHYVISDDEDDSLYILGSEQGNTKLAFAERDILYLSKGSNAGVKAGDLYTAHHPAYEVKHPNSGRTIGRKVETTGWVRVILVQENSSTAVIERSCQDMHAGDYMTPFEKASVPLIVRRAPPDRLTPPSGKIEGAIVDIGDDSMIAGQGQLVSINLGTANGIAPGNIMTIFKIMYPTVPTSRNVLGELAVVSVRERTATA
ncbi:MAG: LysM peptidoglycan-binding domain-containing protein, partial [Actinomycetota bacterium]